MANAENQKKIPIYNASTGKIKNVEKIKNTESEWKKILTPEQFRITRLKGTETAFTGTCPVPPKGEKGIYQCACCGTDLFNYNAKFESGTGWPSFWEPVSELNIKLVPDNSLGMQRTEVLCARCNAHLGHVFDDGPAPTGKRYCINAIALKLAGTLTKTDKAIFAAGCFWGVEAAFQQLKGVKNTTTGYTGGDFKNPTYKDVCSGKTGHAEAVMVEYDPKIISYKELLDFFWTIHDPTTTNRQGPDIGSQYRSAIFYYTPEQRQQATKTKEELSKSKKFKEPIVTQILPAKEFFIAEEYHQEYFRKQGIKPASHIPEKK